MPRLGVEALAADLGMDRGRAARATASTGPSQPELLDALAPRGRTPTQAMTLEWVKCRARAAHLPDALVRLVARSARRWSTRARCSAQPASVGSRPPRARTGAWRPSARRRRRAGTARAAALPIRTGARPLVARQPGQLQFGQPPLAGQAVHDLQLGRACRRPAAAAIRARPRPRRDSRHSSAPAG